MSRTHIELVSNKAHGLR